MAHSLRAELTAAGLDIVESFSVAAYNQVASTIPALVALRLDDEPGAAEPHGFIVGHSRAFWGPFVHWYASYEQRDDPQFLRNPVDLYAYKTISALLEARGVRFRIYSDLEGPLVALQRVAELSGAVTINDALHLCLHPTFGAWIALRAVVVTKEQLLPNSTQSQVQASPITLSEEETLAAKAAYQTAMSAKPFDWRLWLALRDTVAHGREYRYEADQLEYHYTKNPKALERAVLRLSRSGALEIKSDCESQHGGPQQVAPGTEQ